jgi:hypothetical protein
MHKYSYISEVSERCFMHDQLCANGNIYQAYKINYINSPWNEGFSPLFVSNPKMIHERALKFFSPICGCMTVCEDY